MSSPDASMFDATTTTPTLTPRWQLWCMGRFRSFSEADSEVIEHNFLHCQGKGPHVVLLSSAPNPGFPPNLPTDPRIDFEEMRMYNIPVRRSCPLLDDGSQDSPPVKYRVDLGGGQTLVYDDHINHLLHTCLSNRSLLKVRVAMGHFLYDIHKSPSLDSYSKQVNLETFTERKVSEFHVESSNKIFFLGLEPAFDKSRDIISEADAKQITIPDCLFCPITHSLFSYPVVADDGNTYELDAIQTWFRTRAQASGTQSMFGTKSPLTNAPMKDTILPNFILYRMVKELVEAIDK